MDFGLVSRTCMLRYSVSAWGHGLTLENFGAPLDVMSVMSLRKVISRLSYMKTVCHIFQAPAWRINQPFSEILFLRSGGRNAIFHRLQPKSAEEFVFYKLSAKAAQQLFGVGALGVFGAIRGKQSNRSEFWEP